MDYDVNTYPVNVMIDMGFSQDDIDKIYHGVISDFCGLINGGLFFSTRFTIFEQHYIDGYSVQDISSNTGCTKNHVKRELSRIKHTLRKHAVKIVPDTVSDLRVDEEVLIDTDEEWDDWEEEIIPYGKDNPYLVAIEDLGLSIRAYNCLRRAGIKTMGDVLDLGTEGLKKVRNLGSKCYNEIKTVLNKYDISI